MGENVHLCRPSIDLQAEYASFYEDWINSEEEMVPWVISKDPTDFNGMVEFLQNNEKADLFTDGQMPSSTFWMVTDSGRIVGAVNIRHCLTEKAINTRGHIGYGIRPSERRKGYANKLLALSILKSRELGIKRVLIICHEGNVGSEKTIRNNGGVQDTNYTDENGNVLLRFWIDL